MAQTVLLTDADVFIDYRESELDILKLVVQHIGKVVILRELYTKRPKNHLIYLLGSDTLINW